MKGLVATVPVKNFNSRTIPANAPLELSMLELLLFVALIWHHVYKLFDKG